MKKTTRYIFFLFLFMMSCKEYTTHQEQEVIHQQEEAVFSDLSKIWQFNFAQTDTKVTTVLDNWDNWQQLKTELKQKPQTSILAFQQKSAVLTTKSDSLYLTVPEDFNNPQVRSRLIALDTKIQSLDTYIHLNEIPTKKIKTIIDGINQELDAVYNQMSETIIKNEIPLEIGEEIMIQVLDTVRNANFDKMTKAIQKTDSINKIQNQSKIKRLELEIEPIN